MRLRLEAEVSLPLAIKHGFGGMERKRGEGIKKRQDGCRVRELEKVRFGKRMRLALYRTDRL